jgi:Tol biopolymer transport system component
MDADGGQVRQLTADPERTWYGPIAWSPDGKTIAVTGSARAGDENEARIYLVDVVRAETRIFLPDTPAKTPLWLGDGDQLAFISQDMDAGRTALMFTTGGSDDGPAEITVQSERILEDEAQTAAVLGMDASPQGDLVASLILYWVPVSDSELMRNSHVEIEIWDRSAVPMESIIRIQPIPNGIMGLSWSPDGSYLAYLQSVGMSGCWHVHVLRLADGERREVKDLCYTARTLEPDWTPDGQWLVYPADDDGSYKDYAIVAVNIPLLFDDPDHPVVHRLTENDGTAHSPQVRPAGPAVDTTAGSALEAEVRNLIAAWEELSARAQRPH